MRIKLGFHNKNQGEIGIDIDIELLFIAALNIHGIKNRPGLIVVLEFLPEFKF